MRIYGVGDWGLGLRVYGLGFRAHGFGFLRCRFHPGSV